MSTVTGDVCYRSKTLLISRTLIPWGSLQSSKISFVNASSGASETFYVDVQQLVNFYNSRQPAVSKRILQDMKKFSDGEHTYEQLWLYMPKDPCGLQGILDKHKTSSAYSIFSKIFCSAPVDFYDDDRLGY